MSPSLADGLWKRAGPGGMARAVDATVELQAPGRQPLVRGSGSLLVVAGDPGELTLFASGRQPAARVEITGDPALADRLRGASLGV